ncbi:MAG: MXAN_2562 family outer membrane beta-barrel protein [Nitrospirae bacterium]|nr:MXAN_2562 family outer membrane beta-barrel protein [Nitrospirota bacterium]
MQKIILMLLVLLIPAAAYGAEPSPVRPHWSLELKGGRFAPVLENWSYYYGKRDMPVYEGTLAYKVLRQVEFGVGAGTARDKGQGYAPDHGTVSGEVVYELYPVNVFVLVRGVISENQWLVPYIGGGWTRMYYRERIQNQEKVRGSADGYHVRGGLQLLLDGIDRGAANNLSMDFGVYHTYLFVEAERTKVKDKATSDDLGGTAYLGGLLFEF